MKLNLGFTFFLFYALFSFSQNNTIVAGEKLVFTASYNMSGLLTDIAELKMETSTVITSKNSFLRLKCTAATYKGWDNFLKARVLVESYVNPKTITPYLYNRDVSYNGNEKFEKYNYKHNIKKVESATKNKNKDDTLLEQNRSIPISTTTKDIVSTLYYIRSLDIHKASIGETKDFDLLIENKRKTITISYLGKETIDTNIGKKTCYKLALTIKGSKYLKGEKNSNLLWISADANKIPVFAQFNIALGNGELKIVSATGLKK